jgi:uncharacterized protein (TIGR03382 family)
VVVRLVGVILAVAGGVFLWNGMQARESLAERASHALTGQYSDRTTYHMAGGGAALAVGVLLVAVGGGRRR